MSTDKYIFEKSSNEQHMVNTPYENKVWNYINDLNGGQYQNNSLSLCQIDLGSIYNSKYFNQLEDAFLAVPIVMVYVLSNTTTPVAPAAAGTTTCPSSVLAMKAGYYQLVDKVELELDGKVIEQMNPFQNVITHFKMLSQMSPGDLQQYGSLIGLPQLDSANSMKYSSTAGGLQNNFIFGNSLQANGTINLNSGCTNDRLTKAAQRIAFNATNGTANNFELLSTQTQQDNEGRASFRILNTNYGVYYDTAIIRIKDLLDSFNNIPLVKRVQGALRIYFNTGSVAIQKAPGTNSIGPLAAAFTQASTTFSTTCPFTINQSLATVAAPNFSDVNAGLFIARAPTTSLANGINLGASGAAHPTLNGVRLYYSQVELKPQRALEYVSANRSKKVTYNTYLVTSINNIAAASSYSSIIQSGITNIKGVVVIPFIASTTANHLYSQFQSPYDTCPGTFAPLSLSQINVQIGGTNILNVPLAYSFETFAEQIVNWENIVTDFALPVGLVSADWWQNNRVYYIDCSRQGLADQNTPRNLVLQFTNNNNVAIDLLVFTVRGDEFVLDVETGSIRKG
jgi:hypothetical protein